MERHRGRRADRIIPARAGFTASSVRHPAPGTDHPRSRGVYNSRDGHCAGVRGSSPLARGLPGQEAVRRAEPRIIPARAGFTFNPEPTQGGTMDHPRSRGVYTSPTLSLSSHSGSSPLARGLRPPVEPVQVGQGIIPARAGFTDRVVGVADQPEDHPRSRGVYVPPSSKASDFAGSSPLARGLQHHCPDLHRTRGIIPARAGFTSSRTGTTPPASDHPRSRGVYGHPRRRPTGRGGSSPLARGLRHGRAGLVVEGRIIPARAGFTNSRHSPRERRQDHPRSRGVYAGEFYPCAPDVGSSPLARGLHGDALDGAAPVGIIPARAGFTF